MRDTYKLIDVRDIFAEPEKYYDQEVTVAGWVKSNRDSRASDLLHWTMVPASRICSWCILRKSKIFPSWRS